MRDEGFLKKFIMENLKNQLHNLFFKNKDGKLILNKIKNHKNYTNIFCEELLICEEREEGFQF